MKVFDLVNGVVYVSFITTFFLLVIISHFVLAPIGLPTLWVIKKLFGWEPRDLRVEYNKRGWLPRPFSMKEHLKIINEDDWAKIEREHEKVPEIEYWTYPFMGKHEEEVWKN